MTFNDAATAAAIEALIENLAYGEFFGCTNRRAAISRSRSATTPADHHRGDHDGCGAPAPPIRSPALRIWVGFSVGAPSFADLDGDGGLDAVVGEVGGVLDYYRNNKHATRPPTSPTRPASSIRSLASG